jgi:hypothetical protein
MWCTHCADHSSAVLARRIRVLHLLALIEHPDALPHDEALRIAGELLNWLDNEAPSRPALEATAARHELQPA